MLESAFRPLMYAWAHRCPWLARATCDWHKSQSCQPPFLKAQTFFFFFIQTTELFIKILTSISNIVYLFVCSHFIKTPRNSRILIAVILSHFSSCLRTPIPLIQSLWHTMPTALPSAVFSKKPNCFGFDKILIN